MARRLPAAFVCDPEQLGFGLQRMTPPELRGDFQDNPLWRSGTRDLLARNALHGSGPIVVPMTVVNPLYFSEIVGGVREQGVTVQHIVLEASEVTLRQRLRMRGEGAESWAAAQIDRCIRGLAAFSPHERLSTDTLTHTQVVEAIAARLGLTLLPDPNPSPTRQPQRLS